MQKRESINISSLKVRKCNGTECEKRRAMCHGALETDTKLLWGGIRVFGMKVYLHIDYHRIHIYESILWMCCPMMILK